MYNSQLYNEETFYKSFINDMLRCKRELIIESPYLTKYRIEMLMPYFKRLLLKRVKIIIVTRHPSDHSENMAHQTYKIVDLLKNMGIIVFYCGKHHRKIAIIDRELLYEGSLNILSYSYSAELMRRIEGKNYAAELIEFTGLNMFI